MSSPTEAIVNSTLGPMIVGLMLQQPLLGIIFCQTWSYYVKNGTRDEKTNVYAVCNPLSGGLSLSPFSQSSRSSSSRPQRLRSRYGFASRFTRGLPFVDDFG